MRSLLAAVLAVSITTLGVVPVAHAQPGADPQQPDPNAAPPPPPPPPQPYPQQGYPQQPGYPQPGYPQPGYPQQPRPYMPGPGYGPPMQLSPEDQELLAEGEISDSTMLGGVLAAVLLGFGSGQAVEGRWSERGWIFTLGEIGAIVLLVYGVSQAFRDCGIDSPQGTCNGGSDAGSGEIIVGALGLTVLRIWEVVDAVSGPGAHNARVRELRMRMGMRPAYAKVTPYLAPVAHDTGWSAGVAFHF